MIYFFVFKSIAIDLNKKIMDMNTKFQQSGKVDINDLNFIAGFVALNFGYSLTG